MADRFCAWRNGLCTRTAFIRLKIFASSILERKKQDRIIFEWMHSCSVFVSNDPDRTTIAHKNDRQWTFQMRHGQKLKTTEKAIIISFFISFLSGQTPGPGRLACLAVLRHDSPWVIFPNKFQGSSTNHACFLRCFLTLPNWISQITLTRNRSIWKTLNF
jgi:hypothetical protein